MKQINSLIVLSVPKDSKNHRIADEKWVRYDPDGFVMLNSGQYEIIGLFKEVYADFPDGPKWSKVKEACKSEVPTAELIINDVPTPTETSTLLFIHKLK